MIEDLVPGAIVIVHLVGPNEKYWGVLGRIDPTGVVVRGLNLSSVDDWTRTVLDDEPPTLGPTTIFFPMSRVERLFLDETVGHLESMSDRFERRVGSPAIDHLRSRSSADA